MSSAPALLPRPATPVSTPATVELTFATWNIHGCHPEATFDAAAVAEVIARTNADVVALQEAGAMAGGIDHAHAVALLLGMTCVAGPNVERLGGRWRCGNAILTRFPVLGSENHDLSVVNAEPRGCLVARLELPGGGELTAASAHLGLRHRERVRQSERLAAILHAEIAGPLLVGMDANDWFPGRDTRVLRATLTDAGAGARATYPAALPLLRIDHVYVRDAAVERCETLTSSLIRATSDHLPVVARVQCAIATAEKSFGSGFR